jgi:hypothetical protein
VDLVSADSTTTIDGLGFPMAVGLRYYYAEIVAAFRLGCPYVFHRKGQTIGDFKKAWKTACKETCGNSGSDLRRTAARNLSRAGST